MRTRRTIAELSRRRAASGQPKIGLVPTMGAFHEGHSRAPARPRGTSATRSWSSVFVNPAQFARGRGLRALPARRGSRRALAEEAGADVLFAPAADELYPPGFETWVDVERLGSMLEGEHRPGHFRGVATICLQALQPRPPVAGLLRPEGRAAGRRRSSGWCATSNVDVEHPRPPHRARRRRPRALLPQRLPHARGAQSARSRSPEPLPTRDPERARELLNGLEVDYLEVADFEPRVLVAAVRVGKTRLIDNVVLEGDPA